MMSSTSTLFSFLFASLLVCGSATSISSSNDVCSLVTEASTASLTCPTGQIISAITFATFGKYTADSNCTDPSGSGLVPTAECPTSVIPQITRLCAGYNTCNISCDCDSLPSPCGCNSNTVSPSGAAQRLAFPLVPCPQIQKMLGLVATCSDALPPPLLPPPTPTEQVPTNLMLEFMPAPVWGIDNLKPHFSWTPSASSLRLAPSAVQTMARVLVYFYPNTTEGTVVWDSGVVFLNTSMTTSPSLNSSSSAVIPSTALPLTSDTRYKWTVATGNIDGVWTSFAPAVQFSTGLLAPTDWSGAQWIGGWKAGTLMRKDFTVSNSSSVPAYASVFVSACQYYYLYIDGARVGTRELDVAWTRFQYFRSYASYQIDLTSPTLPFTPGSTHTIGLALGQGFCGQSGGNAGNHSTTGFLRFALYAADGTLLQPPLVTDTTWTTSSGPVLTDSTYFGEQYNASMEQPGWNAPGFVPSPISPPWTPAVVIIGPSITNTSALMSSQVMPAIERINELTPLAVTALAGTLQQYTFDFGQQIAGRVRLQLPIGVPAGTNITMKHTEVLCHPPYATYDGAVWMGNLFWAFPVDSYITSGTSSSSITAADGESYEPAFTEHGFRYVQVSIDPPIPQLDQNATMLASLVTAVVLRTAARVQSQMFLGHPILQVLSNNSRWTEGDAIIGIPQGAAARGERTGWTGDSSFSSESELFDYDTGAFFSQFLLQLQQLQCSDGTVPSCIPNSDPHRDGQPAPLPCTNEEGDPSWGTVYPTIAWGVWKYYGALGVAAQHYPSLKTYLSMLMTRVNNTGIGQIFCEWGDWNPVVKTSCHITAAASYLHDLQHMVEFSTALGELEDAAMYLSVLQNATLAYHTAFWNTSLGLYGDGTQTAQGVALWTGVAATANVSQNVSAWLATSLVNEGLTFGFLGVRYVYEALARNGHIEAALRSLLFQTTYPSYGFELFNEYEPATSLWESWDAPTHNQWLDESSRNHHYQASINTFLRKYVIGVDMPQGATAWSTVLVKPYAAVPSIAADVASALPYARTTIASYRGTLEVSWQRIGSSSTTTANAIQLNVTLPSGVNGLVSVPKSFGNVLTQIFEGTVVIWTNGAFIPGAVPGIESAMEEDGVNGDYVTFTVTSGAFVFTTSNATSSSAAAADLFF